MSCINKNDKNFKLAKARYGASFAESAIRNISKSKGLIDDFYYPTIKEIKEYYKNEIYKKETLIFDTLKKDTNLTLKTLTDLLQGVIHKHNGIYFVTQGFGNNQSSIIRADNYTMIYRPNLEIIKKLEEMYPDIFSRTYVVKYTPPGASSKLSFVVENLNIKGKEKIFDDYDLEVFKTPSKERNTILKIARIYRDVPLNINRPFITRLTITPKLVLNEVEEKVDSEESLLNKDLRSIGYREKELEIIQKEGQFISVTGNVYSSLEEALIDKDGTFELEDNLTQLNTIDNVENTKITGVNQALKNKIIELKNGKKVFFTLEESDILYNLLSNKIKLELKNNNINNFNEYINKQTPSSLLTKIINYIKYLLYQEKFLNIIDKIKKDSINDIFTEQGNLFIQGITKNQRTKLLIINKLLFRGVTPFSYNKLIVLGQIPFNLFFGQSYKLTNLFIEKLIKIDKRYKKYQLTEEQYNKRMDSWRLSNGLPQKHNTFKYIGKGYLDKNYNFVEDKNGEDFYDFVDPVFKEKELKLIKKDANLTDIGNLVMGNYYLKVGKDEYGYFYQYTDRWDLDLKNKLLNLTINKTQKPFNILGKIYTALSYNNEGEEFIYLTYNENDPNVKIYKDFNEYFEYAPDDLSLTEKLDNKYLQLASDLVNPAIEELDNYLLDFLKNFNVKSKEFDELKSRLGVNALGATDVLNKLIWYVKNRNEKTLPEEAAHMLVTLMGENHPDIKELLNNITNWSEYEDIKNQYLPIYKDIEKVKIEAVGKLIAESLVKNYKVNGLDKNKLQKTLDRILNFIEDILNNLNIGAIFYYNDAIADHIAINILSGNKDYIYKIKNLNSNLNAKEEINNNPNAKRIINRFSSNNVKMTGSLAIAGTENIRRPKGQGIHDIDFKVKSFSIYENEILPKIPDNAVPAHFGWHKKSYSTFAYLIPKEEFTINVKNRKDDFSNGWITEYDLLNEKGEIVEKTQDNIIAVDFFVYKEDSNQKDFSFENEFIPASLVYEGKMSLGGKSNPYFFSRDKDQEDYVLRNPKSFIPFEKHIYYQLSSDQSTEIKPGVSELFESNSIIKLQNISSLGNLEGDLMQSEKGQIGVNKQQLLMLLGPTMYNKPLAQVAVKELLQNSFDAVKARQNISDNKNAGNITIKVDYDNRTISIQDDGIGMTTDIVKNAFLSIGGTNKEGLDVSERSGGFGLAKVQFLLGSEYVKVTTVRDGIKTTLEASAIQLYNDDFEIFTEKTNEPNGSFVEVKIPESYTTPEGTKREIDFPGRYSSKPYNSFDILDKPLIGDANIKFTWIKNNKTAEKILPIGINSDETTLPPLFSKIDFKWGSADLYMSTEKKENPKHRILSSGIYQFNYSFRFKGWEDIPYDIVINIKPSVSSTSEQYPFNNQREGFKNTIQEDIKSLNNYLKKYASGEAEKDAKAVFSNITGLPKVDPNKVLTPEEREKLYADVEKTIEENKKRRIEQGLETAEEELRKIYKLIIDETGVTNQETGEVEVSKEKNYDSTFKAEKEIEKVDAIEVTNFNPALPQYHNNTNFDYLSIDGAAEFFSDFGSVVLEMVRFAGNELGYDYKKLKSEDEKFFAGVSIDKQYGGVHVRKIINAIFVNPLAFNVSSLEEAVGVALHVAIHEINHTTVSGEGAEFTTALGILYGKIYATGKYGLYEGLFRSVYKKHFETFKKLKYEYDKSSTRNLSESFQGDKIEKSSSGNVQRNANDVSTGQSSKEGYRGNQKNNTEDKSGDVIASNLAKSKKVIAFQQQSSIKPGVAELFESTPELANIGTPEQYSKYLSNFVNTNFDEIIADLQSKKLLEKKCS